MSRRFRNRHAKVVADPEALPVAATVLDDSNSFIDPTQYDRRIPLTLNSRGFVVAQSSLAEDDYVELHEDEPASTPEPTALDRLAALKAQIAQIEAENGSQA